jgi:hypothetical protein
VFGRGRECTEGKRALDGAPPFYRRDGRVARGEESRGGRGCGATCGRRGASPDQRAASRPCRSPATTLTGGAALFEQGAPGSADAWAIADSGREEEERGAEHVGRPRGKLNGPSPKE